MAFDYDKFLQEQGLAGGSPPPTASPTVPSPTPSPTPAGGGEEAGKALKDFLKGVLAGGKEIVSNPLESLKNLSKGAGAGGLEMLANLLSVGSKANSLFGGSSDFNKLKTESQKAAAESLRGKAEQVKGGEKSGAQKFVTEAGEFILPSLVPIPGGGALSKVPLIGKLLKSGVELASQAAYIYNPKDHPEGAGDEAFFNEMGQNFIGGVIFKGVEGAGKTTVKIVLKPMEKAAEIVANKLNKFYTEDFFKRSVPAMTGYVDENLVSMASKDFLAVLKGEKAMDSNAKDFFGTKDWAVIVKKYGVDINNYPHQLSMPKGPMENSTINSGPLAYLTANKYHNDFITQFGSASEALSTGNKEGYSLALQGMKTAADTLEQQGYKVDRPAIISTVQKLSDSKREFEDFMTQVVERETDTQLLDMVGQEGLEKPLKTLSKIYRLIQNKKGFEDSKVIMAFNKWADKNGSPHIDEISDLLVKSGIDESVLDPGTLIEFAGNLPTKAKMSAKILEPAPYDPFPDIRAAVKSGEKQFDAPFRASREEASAAVEKMRQQALSTPSVESSVTRQTVEETMSAESTQKMATVNSRVQSELPNPNDQKSVVDYYFSLISLSDEKTDPIAAFKALGSFGDILSTQLKDVAKATLPEEAGARLGRVSGVIEGLKNTLFNTPFVKTLFSEQNKISTMEHGRVSSVLDFLQTFSNIMNVASGRLETEMKKLLTPETKLKFASVVESGDLKGLTEGEIKAVSVWNTYASSVYKTINSLRITAGRKPLPPVERYFPRQLEGIVKEAMEDIAMKDGVASKVDSKFLLKRSLESLQSLHEKDIDKVLPVYNSQIRYHVEYLMKQVLDKESLSWTGKERDMFLTRLRTLTPMPSVEKEFEQFFTEAGHNLGTTLGRVWDKVMPIKTFEKVPLTPELKEFLMGNEKLSAMPAIKELMEKGFWEVDKFHWAEKGSQATTSVVMLSSLAKLVMNAAFTVVNMTQSAQEVFKVGGASAVGDIAKGYAKGYVIYPFAKLIGAEYGAKEVGLLKLLGYAEAKFGAYGEGVTILNNLGVIGKSLGFNITATERMNRVTSLFAFESLMKRRLPNMSANERKYLAATLSAHVNFISGKYVNPTIKSGLIGKALYQFSQFPISDSIITLNAWQNILSKDKPAANVFMNLFHSVGDENLMKKLRMDIDNLAPASLDNFLGLFMSGATVATLIVTTFNMFNIINGMVTGKEPYLTTMRAKKEAISAVVPGYSLVDKFSQGGSASASEPTTALSVPTTPATDLAIQMKNMAMAATGASAAIMSGDVTTANEQTQKFYDSVYAVSPVFLQRLKDFYDANDTGSVKSIKDNTKVQYKLSETKAEDPLTVLLFGRGSLSGYEQYSEARVEAADQKGMNEKATAAFMQSLTATDPVEKENALNLYYAYVGKGAKPINYTQLQKRLKSQGQTVTERLLQSLPTEQKRAILNQY